MNKKSFSVAREALKLQAPIYNSQLLEIKVGGRINEIKLKLLNGKFYFLKGVQNEMSGGWVKKEKR